MTQTRKLCIALFLSTLALTATAQDRPAASPASPTPSTTLAHDCVKPMPRHDHTAEKGTPTPKSIIGPCGPSAAASAPKAKAQLRHDHAKFHKNQ
jgi:hypothetical protein